MTMDAYEPCPCGSGKKLKFCCQKIVGEMEKIVQLQKSNQPHIALQRLSTLERSHPGNPWIATSRAAILLNEDKSDEASQILDQFVAANPDHVFGQVLHATALFAAKGFDAAKQAIHRAFQRSAGSFPDMVGGLAIGVAGVMAGTGRPMAARQHLALAIRLVPDKDRQDVFLRLLRFDSNGDLPYPLRSVHQLVDYSGSEEIQAQSAQARRLSDFGCWEAAAKIFNTLAEQEPDNAALWHNVGLCRAWDGDVQGAAEALHLAGRLHDKFETAVECETVAQLLDQHSDEDAVEVLSVAYRVQSVSKLLTLLLENDRLARLKLPPQEQSEQRLPVAMFYVLDRPEPTEQAAESFTLDTVPNVLAQISLIDAEDDEPAKLYLTGFEGEPLDVSKSLLQEAAGGEIEIDESDEDDDVTESVPPELYALYWRWYFPPKTPILLRRKLEQEKWLKTVTEVWAETKLSGLGGKTPLDASGDSDQKVALTASVYVLDAYCARNRSVLDFDLLHERLDFDGVPPIEVTEDMPLNSFSAMQLHRLPVPALSDSQIAYTLNRALLIHHGSFLYEVLTEVLNRPPCLEKVDLNRVYLTLADLCRDRYKRDEALSWIEKGCEWAKTQEKAFEETLQWEMKELTFRLEDRDDPELNPLLKRLWDYYGSKLPELRSHLSTLVEAVDIRPPWELGEVVVAPDGTAGSTTEGGLWTPDAAGASPQGEEKKLWLPGQD